jgi:cobalt-zinc-cadmium efflux system outer membrane protein
VRRQLAEARQAQAEAAMGDADRWPGVSLGAAYERDEGADIVLGILGLQLPLFQRGQGERAVGQARARRLRLEAEAATRSGAAVIQAAQAAHEQRLAAARALETVLPSLDGTEELARKSHEAGQLSLAEWMVVRREAVETRLEYLQQLLGAAEAGVALANLAGVSP